MLACGTDTARLRLYTARWARQCPKGASGERPGVDIRSSAWGSRRLRLGSRQSTESIRYSTGIKPGACRAGCVQEMCVLAADFRYSAPKSRYSLPKRCCTKWIPFYPSLISI